MKNILSTLLFLGALNFANSQCNTATYGQFPTATFTPTNTGAWETVTTAGYSGEYSVLNVISGNIYDFQSFRTSNNASRFVTLTNSAGTAIKSGTTTNLTSLNWVATFTGTIRFYQHNSNTCTSGTAGSTRRVKVTVPVNNDNSNCSYLVDLSLPTVAGSSSTTGNQSTCGKGNDFPANSFGSSLYGDGEDAVWRIIVPSGGGNYQFDLGGSGTYKILSLHSACTPSNSNVIDWNSTSSGTTTSFTENLLAGTYYLWTDTWPSPTCGQYSITVTKLNPPLPPPLNDNPSGAVMLTVNDAAGYATYSNANSTNTTTESTPSCALYSGEDVWFKITVPAGSTILDFDTQSEGITDGGMSIYRGTIGSLIEIECDDDDALDGNMPWIYREDFIPGETIYIRFWEYGGGTTGTFKIFISSPQALPVELFKFEAIPYPKWNVIEWITASESNSSHFDLYSSQDGEEWRKISTRQAANNSTESIKYFWIDYNLNELTYYKLIQFDNDGKFSEFGPIYVQKGSISRKIIKFVNSMGQEINPLTATGLVIEIYDDGSIRKLIR